MERSFGIYVGPDTIIASAKRGQQYGVIGWTRTSEHKSINTALSAVLEQADPQLSAEPLDVVVAVPSNTRSLARQGILRTLEEVNTSYIRIITTATAGVASVITYSSVPVYCSVWELRNRYLTLSLITRYMNSVTVDHVFHDENEAWRTDGAFASSYIASDSSSKRVDRLLDTVFESLDAEAHRFGPWGSGDHRRAFILGERQIDKELANMLARVTWEPELLTDADISTGAARIAASMASPPTLHVQERVGMITGLKPTDSFVPFFKTNDSLPAVVSATAAPMEPGQQSFSFGVVQSLSDEPTDTNLDSIYRFTRQSDSTAGESGVEVEISVTVDGILHIVCSDPVSREALEGILMDSDAQPVAIQCEKCGSLSDFGSLFCLDCGDPFLTMLTTDEQGTQSLQDEPAPAAVPSSTSQRSPSADQPASPEQLESTDPIDTSGDLHECPYCAELIKKAAIKCRHCGEFLSERIATGSGEISPDGSLDPATSSDEAGALTQSRTQYSHLKLFVSHATADKEAAADIVQALDGYGITTWIAARDIQVGDNYAAQIYGAISSSTHMLVLLSPESVASNHVRREVNLAIDKDITVLPLIVSTTADFMLALPADWKYWLGVIQAVPYSGADVAAATLVRRLEMQET